MCCDTKMPWIVTTTGLLFYWLLMLLWSAYIHNYEMVNVQLEQGSTSCFVNCQRVNIFDFSNLQN